MYSFPLESNDGRHVKKDSGKEEITVQYFTERLGSQVENLSPERSISKLDPSILNIRRSRVVIPSGRELFLQHVQGFRNSIPKHITTFDEKYVLHCLELIRNYSLRASSWDLAEIKNMDSYNMASLAIEPSDLSIGTISGSQSMINILNSPLLQKFAFLDHEINFERKTLACSDFVEYPQESKKEVTFVDHKSTFEPMHKRIGSMSSTTYSSCSDQTSSSISVSSFQAMLQCTWKDGLPNHVFTLDDKREVYVANLSKVESLDSKDLDYVYSFYSRRNGFTHKLELESVGKMRVSTSIMFCSNNNNSKVRETWFILSASNENPIRGTETSIHTVRKNKRFSRKVVDALLPSHSYKISQSGESSAIFEDTLWDPSEEVDTGLNNKYVPNLELAAIMVKEICKNDKEIDIGGWGLKFLKKSGNNVSGGIPSKCALSDGKCSNTVNVLIPAGFHGGPRTQVGGPASLTERWASSGRCDCGGWDIGCPLTVLNTKSTNQDSSSEAENSGECKSVDLFMQGSKEDVPIMKMVNIHEGLYCIHFQSTLSSLQSFAIATAIIHSHNPVLRPTRTGASWN